MAQFRHNNASAPVTIPAFSTILCLFSIKQRINSCHSTLIRPCLPATSSHHDQRHVERDIIDRALFNILSPCTSLVFVLFSQHAIGTLHRHTKLPCKILLLPRFSVESLHLHGIHPHAVHSSLTVSLYEQYFIIVCHLRQHNASHHTAIRKCSFPANWTIGRLALHLSNHFH